MQARLNYMRAAPEVLTAMMGVSNASQEGSIEPSLAELVKMRASQLNGCAFCLDMHAREAIEAGENPQRLHTLAGWRDSPFYSDRERAALAWTERMTALAGHHVPDEAYEAMAEHFTPQEQAELMLLIAVINAWNRFNVGFGVAPAAQG